ncbi:hypothetical protein Tco_1359469 [Tanacetum coccineum]
MLFIALMSQSAEWSSAGDHVVAVDRLWEHIPIVGLMVVENKRCGEQWIVEIKTVGECVYEIDKLAELIGDVNSTYSLSLVTPSSVIEGQTSGPFSTDARIKEN